MQSPTRHLYTEQGFLTPIPPFDFTKSLDFLGHFAPTSGEQTTTAHVLTKAVYVAGQLIAFQLSSTGSIEEPQLAYTLFSAQPIDAAIKSAAVDRMRFFLSLDDNLRPFYEQGLADPDFAPIVQEQYGYHQVKFLTPFEIACWAVLTQRNPQNVAQKMKKVLVETYGGSVEVQETTYWAFPEAAHLAHVSADELLTVVHNARKAEYLHAGAQAFKAVDEHFLRTADYAEVASWLRSIRGFGEWSVSFVMLRGLGRMEQIPLTEKRIQEAMSRMYGHGKALSREEIAHIAERYGAYQGYWAHYLRVSA